MREEVDAFVMSEVFLTALISGGFQPLRPRCEPIIARYAGCVDTRDCNRE